jgi:hypothetical protein
MSPNHPGREAWGLRLEGHPTARTPKDSVRDRGGGSLVGVSDQRQTTTSAISERRQR